MTNRYLNTIKLGDEFLLAFYFFETRELKNMIH